MGVGVSEGVLVAVGRAVAVATGVADGWRNTGKSRRATLGDGDGDGVTGAIVATGAGATVAL
jgi:hypothetical protein